MSTVYTPPYSCQCSAHAMVNHFNAMYTEKDLKSPDQPIEVKREVRLVKGPAYGQVPDGPPAGAEDGGKKGKRKAGNASDRWSSDLPLTGRAIALADDTLFVAGTAGSTCRCRMAR